MTLGQSQSYRCEGHARLFCQMRCPGTGSVEIVSDLFKNNSGKSLGLFGNEFVTLLGWQWDSWVMDLGQYC